MSISPATDIVLDVARAADPTRYKRAVARLDETARAGFADSLAAEESAPPRSPQAPPGSLPQQAVHQPVARASGAETDKTDKTASTYRQFEAMALANMLESAMPSDEGFFGKGVAGDTWKSMLIDQIANEMAKHGGVGIARQLARSAEATHGGHSAANLTTAGQAALTKTTL